MRLSKKSLQEVVASNQPVIGFWGSPPRAELKWASAQYGNLEFFDLDVYYGVESTRIIPDAFCHIIRNCVDNAIALGPLLKCVVAATGPEKCDAGRFAAELVNSMLEAKVVVSTNDTLSTSVQPLLCEARGPLKKRAIRIMESIVEPLTEKERNVAFMTRCEPTHGFWGTPPHPIEVLDLFPETTHLFGWTRCVEQERSADLQLEMTVPEDLPTVFFSQGFCQKAMLARSLAEKHGGMHVDVHDNLNAATMAKIEAFVRLSGE